MGVWSDSYGREKPFQMAVCWSLETISDMNLRWSQPKFAASSKWKGMLEALGDMSVNPQAMNVNPQAQAQGAEIL